MKDGVKVLDAVSHIEYCLEILRKKISSSVYKKLKYQYKSMLSDGFFNNRSGQLHFILSKELTRASGCVGLYKYYGGEALRRIIEYAELSDQVLPVLNRIGEPMVIEFDLLGIKLRGFGLRCIAEHLLKTIYKDENKHIIFLCEAFITHSMARKDIMGYWTMVKYW